MGEASLAAHQVAFQLFVFVLDAIAGQIMVALAAGDSALIAGIGIIPRAFTGDPAMIQYAQALWPFFALALHLGVSGVWVALNVLIAVRFITCGARFVGRRCTITGASGRARAF